MTSEKSEVCSDCLELQTEFAKNPGGKKMQNKGLLIAGVVGGCALAISTVCIPFLTPALRKFCLPFVPATDAQVKNVLSALSGRKGTLVDIGSGDGRIVFECAKNGFKSHGIELNLWLVLYSKFKSWKLSSTATFQRKNLWKERFGSYDNVVIFGVEEMMLDLEKKLINEMNSQSQIIACRFPLPNLKPKKVIGDGIDTIWTYDLKDVR